MEPNLTGLILDHAGTTGIRLTAGQAELFRRHVELMLEWNRRLNLTRITSRDEILVKHLLDSILPAPALPHSGASLDVGTGAGFPGVPLKILHPDLDMVLLDSNRKKTSFLTALIGALGLKGIRALHGRWEELATAAPNRDRFQLITMRAVRLETTHLSILAAKTLRPGGLFAWWAGPEADKKAPLPAGTTPMASLPEIPYILPGIEKIRSVRLWEKSS